MTFIRVNLPGPKGSPLAREGSPLDWYRDTEDGMELVRQHRKAMLRADKTARLVQAKRVAGKAALMALEGLGAAMMLASAAALLVGFGPDVALYVAGWR